MVESVKQARPIVPSCPVVEWIVRKARRWGRRGRWRDERGIAGWACGERERKKKTMAARIVGVKASSLISRADVFFRVKKERLLSGLRGFSFFSRIKTTYIKYGYLLIPVFSLPSFSFFIITHDIIMLLCLFKKHLSNFTNRSISKKLNANRILPVQKVSMEKLEISIPNNDAKQHYEFVIFDDINIATDFIQKRGVLCTQRKLNRRRKRRKGCLHVCGPILSSICMSLFTASGSDFSRRE